MFHLESLPMLPKIFKTEIFAHHTSIIPPSSFISPFSPAFLLFFLNFSREGIRNNPVTMINVPFRPPCLLLRLPCSLRWNPKLAKVTKKLGTNIFIFFFESSGNINISPTTEFFSYNPFLDFPSSNGIHTAIVLLWWRRVSNPEWKVWRKWESIILCNWKKSYIGIFFCFSFIPLNTQNTLPWGPRGPWLPCRPRACGRPWTEPA